jgi:hypothetical protein
MPQGLQQLDIDPKTGELAKADDPNKRAELFINGTGPTAASTETAAETATPEPTPESSVDPNSQPEPPPAPSPKPTARADRRGAFPDESTMQGTITLDIDPTTGLIAVDTCPVIRTRTFALGTEPKKYCGPEHHQGNTAEPGATRPRVTQSPPPR